MLSFCFGVWLQVHDYVYRFLFSEYCFSGQDLWKCLSSLLNKYLFNRFFVKLSLHCLCFVCKKMCYFYSSSIWTIPQLIHFLFSCVINNLNIKSWHHFLSESASHKMPSKVYHFTFIYILVHVVCIHSCMFCDKFSLEFKETSSRDLSQVHQSITVYHWYVDLMILKIYPVQKYAGSVRKTNLCTHLYVCQKCPFSCLAIMFVAPFFTCFLF